MIDEQDFKNVWALLCERFNREPSQVMMRAYYHALKDRIDTEQFKAAGSRIFESAEFFPKPADFLPNDSDTHLDAVEQWGHLQSAMKGIGSYDDLNANGTVAVRLLGGQRKLADTKLDDVQWVRRDFLKLYEDAVAIAQREDRPVLEASEEAEQIAAGVELNRIEQAEGT